MKLTTVIGIYVLVACALIFAGITAVLESTAAKGVKEQAHRVTHLLQMEMVECVDGEISSVEANVHRTASASEEFGKFRNESNISTILRLMISGDSTIMGGAFAYVAGHAPEGKDRWMIYAHRTDSAIICRQLASTDYDYTSMDWFANPVATAKPGWSQPYFDKGAGDCLMTTYSQPLTAADGKVTGVVTADVELTTLINSLQRLRPYPTSRSFLLDKDGKLIGDAALYEAMSENLQNILENIDLQVENGAFRDQTFSISGEEYLSNYSSLEGLALIVCTVTPYDSVVSVFRSMRLPFLLVIILGLLLLFGGIYAVIRYAAKPLSRLTGAAGEIGRGNFNAELPAVGGFTDLRQLRDAMQVMESSIATYVADIKTATRKSERIRSELDIAANIQRSMLPGKWEMTDGICISSLLESAREVSGDMYDYVRNGEAVYVLVADVSGKGVPASLVMTSVLSLFRAEASRGILPSEILAGINRTICKGNTNCMFVTAIILRLQHGRLTIANAGHNPPLIMRHREWELMPLNPALPMGIMEETVYGDEETDFGPHSRLLLYTDGLTEAENGAGEQFGEKRLVHCLSSHTADTPEEVVNGIRRYVADFAPEGIADDITIVCVGHEPEILHTSLGYFPEEIAGLQMFIEKLGMPKDMAGKGNLILEEAVANIINHSTPATADDKIEITATKAGDGVVFTISDSGTYFNPLEDSPEVDITLPAEQRRVGGLGIFLLRQLADEISYNRDNNLNTLTIKIKYII